MVGTLELAFSIYSGGSLDLETSHLNPHLNVNHGFISHEFNQEWCLIEPDLAHKAFRVMEWILNLLKYGKKLISETHGLSRF